MAKFSTAFKVVNERNCPYYKVNDCFILNNHSLKVPDGIPSCLILVREFTNILFSMAPGMENENSAAEKKMFSCGGCTGLIKFMIDDVPAHAEKPAADHENHEEADLPAIVSGKQKNGRMIVSGALSDISPSELLQFFHMHQKTGNLRLDVPAGTAVIAFREGAIIGARYGEKEDKDAIFSVLGESRGEFSFETGLPEKNAAAEGIGDFMMILLEGLKRLDETAAEKE
ncbi:MAG: DUF4388 domain-containing protein [Desulfobulbaceae bacterium]|nr:DUF4388 domain-containing protein [Desulfobulbaceae bacterium]